MKTLALILLVAICILLGKTIDTSIKTHRYQEQQTALSKLRDSLSEERKMREWYQQRFERDSKK